MRFRVFPLEWSDRRGRRFHEDMFIFVQPFVDLIVHVLHVRFGELRVEDAASDRAQRFGIWAAMECLKKAGAALDAPLLFDRSTADGWVVLKSGPFRTATYRATLRDVDSPVIVAVSAGSTGESI